MAVCSLKAWPASNANRVMVPPGRFSRVRLTIALGWYTARSPALSATTDGMSDGVTAMRPHRCAGCSNGGARTSARPARWPGRPDAPAAEHGDEIAGDPSGPTNP